MKNRSNIDAKLDKKSMKTQSQIDETSMKNRFWAPRGARGRLLEPFRRVLDASWHDLSAVLAPKMAQNGSKIDSKIDEFFDTF